MIARPAVRLAIALAIAGCWSMPAAEAQADPAAPWARSSPQGARELAAIAAEGTLRIAADPTAGPPYFSVGARGHVGFEVEMASALARRLGARAVFVPTPWRELRDAVASGRADVALNALEIRDDGAVRFSKPYYVASQAILVRAGELKIHELHDLAGRRVATTRGSTAAAILQTLKPKAVPILADDTETPFRALAARRADAVLLEAAMVRAWLQRNPGAYRLAGRPVLPRPYGVAVRRGSPKLLAAIDRALAAMRADGEHAKILRGHGLWDSLQGVRKVVAPAVGPTPVPPALSPAPKPSSRPGRRDRRLRNRLRSRVRRHTPVIQHGWPTEPPQPAVVRTPRPGAPAPAAPATPVERAPAPPAPEKPPAGDPPPGAATP